MRRLASACCLAVVGTFGVVFGLTFGLPVGDARAAAPRPARFAAAASAPPRMLSPPPPSRSVPRSRRASPSSRSSPSSPSVPGPADSMRAPLPFASGEVAAYAVSFGALHVGNGSMTVSGTDTVRGHVAWHAVFLINAGTLFFKVRDRIESWFDLTTLSSLRFSQNIHEVNYRADRLFEIYPDRATYIQRGKDEEPSVHEPLDDASFLYFIRTLPLDVGRQYAVSRYFQPAGNPVSIRVVRRERVTVPAGTFDAVVIQPKITTQGIFSEQGHAEVWIADDPSHVILQVKSGLSFGSINLYLSHYTPGTPATGAR